MLATPRQLMKNIRSKAHDAFPLFCAIRYLACSSGSLRWRCMWNMRSPPRTNSITKNSREDVWNTKVILIKPSLQPVFKKNVKYWRTVYFLIKKNLVQNCYWPSPGRWIGVPQGRDACYWLSPGRRIIPIGCYLEAGVESNKEGTPAIGCHLAGGLFLLAVTWKQEWSPTRNGWLLAVSKTCFSVCTQSMSSSSVTSSFFITWPKKIIFKICTTLIMRSRSIPFTY
jgi:hypothetical protein